MPRSEDISGDDTVTIAEADASRFPVIRYQFRAAAHHIASECERMLGEVVRPGKTAWRDALGEALIGSRHLAAMVDHSLGAFDDLSIARVATLRAEMREPQERIHQALSTLLSYVPTDPADELLLHDARLTLEATLRVGGFSEMPARPTAGGPAQAGLAAAPAAETVRPRLLVVDDEPSLRRALSRLLGHLGYEVTVAANGIEALGATAAHAFDLILTDISMPGLDGFELLRRLKNDDATRHIPVIMVSGLDDLQSVVRCIEQGAEDHITKPYEAILLQARVRAVLERKRMRDVELEYLGRVALLTSAAEAVEHGTYAEGSLEAQAGHDDELGRLARVFDRMVSGWKSREVHLQHRLKELRREIRQSRGENAIAGVSEESPFKVGDVLANRYAIIGELGKGGMGMVYLARDTQLSEELAIKIVRSDVLAQDPTLIERLKSEIRLVRRVSHRNVVRAHDLGEWRGVHFLTMEYVKGISVADLLQTRGRLTVESTLAIATQLAEALAVAHDQQIIHRDIKPANLLVDEEGTLKVMDFGLARLTERSGDLTSAGLVVGTPRYMAPEQLFGGEVDGRSDLFAAGVVIYECLTGTPPFDGSTPAHIIAQIIDGEPRGIRGFVPDVPARLISLVERLLQKDPKDRFSSAHELADQLNQIGQTGQSGG